MNFETINEWFWSLPQGWHLLTFAVMIGLFTHLIFGFWMVRRKLPPHVIKYFVLRSLVVLILLFYKIDGILDLYLPMYIFSYFDGLIILNGFGFYRCKNMSHAFNKLTTFNTVKKINR